MRYLSPLLRACLALMFFVVSLGSSVASAAAPQPAVASTAPVMLEEFTITKESPSLYRAWAKHDHAYKKAHPWTEVWNANCTRANIPCTDRAWRRLAAGGKFYLPAPVIRIEIAGASAAPEALALVPANGTIGMFEILPAQKAQVLVERDQLQRNNKEYVAQLGRANAETKHLVSFLYAFAAALVMLLFLLVFIAYGRKRLVAENLALKTRVSDMEAALDVSRRSQRAAPLPDVTLHPVALATDASGQPVSATSIMPSIPRHAIMRQALPEPVELVFDHVDELGNGHAYRVDANEEKYLLSDVTEGFVASDWKEGQRFLAEVTRARFVARIIQSSGHDDEMPVSFADVHIGREGDAHARGPQNA